MRVVRKRQRDVDHGNGGRTGKRRRCRDVQRGSEHGPVAFREYHGRRSDISCYAGCQRKREQRAGARTRACSRTALAVVAKARARKGRISVRGDANDDDVRLDDVPASEISGRWRRG